MTRAQRVLSYTVIASTFYLMAWFSILPVPDVVRDEILPVIPWWLLVTFGAYALYTLGWNVMTIRDCPEAYTELLSEITQAKNELRAKGVSVD